MSEKRYRIAGSDSDLARSYPDVAKTLSISGRNMSNICYGCMALFIRCLGFCPQSREEVKEMSVLIKTMNDHNVRPWLITSSDNLQYRVAKSKGIGMTFAISDLKNVPLPDDDIVVLLGNLLENAVRACEKVIEQGRTASVSVKFVEKDGRIILNVRNPISEKVEIVDNKVVNPSEEGHGIGLSNVESVAEKNDGTFAISCDDKEFIAVVMI